MDAAEDDDVGGGFGGHLGETEGVADVIGDVLDFWDLVVVGEDDGVEFFLEGEDVAGEGVEARGRSAGDGFEAINAGGAELGQIDHAET